MSEAEPLQQQGYVEVTSSPSIPRRNAAITLVSNRRWKLCLKIGLASSVLILTILVALLWLGVTKDKVVLEQIGNTPLLKLSFPIIERRTPHRHSNKTIRPEVWATCIEEAKTELRNRKTIEEELFRFTNSTSSRNKASTYHQQVTTLSPEMANSTDSAVLAEYSIRLLLDKENVSISEMNSSEQISGLLVSEWSHCSSSRPKRCRSEDRYRSLDGSCNNLRSPMIGASLQPFRRILPAAYDDHFSSGRTKSVMGDNLPLAREISRRFTDHATTVASEDKLSMLFLTWGQFLDHDLTNTGSTKGVNGSAITCCDLCSQCRMHPECFPIMVDRNDPFYADKGVHCLDFVRSAPAPQCEIDGREQFNQATAYIDGSMIYATTRLEADIRLRAHFKGTLRARLHHDGRWLLPISAEPKDGCNKDELIKQSRYCFKAGDVRVNEQIGLTSLHTVWMREHNRIANVLSDLNKHWDDTKVYEESRRIVIAKVQHITYNEFVPLLLGEQLTTYLKLRPHQNCYDNSYNVDIHAGISNEFSTAAFRFGHSMLQGLVELHGAQGRNIDYIQWNKILFNPFALWDFGKLDAVVRGNAEQKPRKLDTSFSSQVTNHMFQPEKSNHGFDLFALNVQRGRDHGLAPYYQWRELCNLSAVNSWEDLELQIRPVSFNVLKQIYKDVKDVDLYVGILAENPLPDGILGPVGSCIIADQFLRLKIGDRFWYETGDVQLRFTPEQLNEIRKSTLARVLCNNGDAMDAIQVRAMESVGPTNPRRSCAGNEIPQIDLTLWEEDATLPNL